MKATFVRPVSKPTSVLDEVVNLLGRHGLLDLPEPYRGKMIDVCCRCIKKGRKEGRKQIIKSNGEVKK